MQIAEQISDFLLDGAITNALNFPSISAEERPKLMPFLKFAGQLGSFVIAATSKSGPGGREVLSSIATVRRLAAVLMDRGSVLARLQGARS